MADLKDIRLEYLPEDREGVYLVGGTVRDLLAGHRPADVDLAAAGDIGEIARDIAAATGGRIVDLGKKGFPILRIAASRITVDITPLAPGGIHADLQNRDFTVNAMAYDLHRRRLVDDTGGLDDLRHRRIRVVSPAAFQADPARLVRAFRMAAAFGFAIDAGTLEAVARSAHRIGTVAGERIWSELAKFFAVDDTAALMPHMAATGLLTAIFPELEPAKGCTQNHHHQWDVFEHSLRAYSHVEALLRAGASVRSDPGGAWPAGLGAFAPILKYSALLHDVGKPAVRQTDATGRVRFRGHAAKSADITAGISRRLRLSARQRDDADGIIRHHLRPLFLFQASTNGTLSRQATVRFFNRCGRLAVPVIVHTRADILAKKAVPGPRDAGFLAFCDRLLDAYDDYRHRQAERPPLVNGRDLIALFDLPPSPRFATILKQVDERRLAGELTDRDQALDWVRQYLQGTDERRRKSEDR
jgi:tRNA nucleotidyltransferase/poly(A) polymerase